MNAQTLAKTLAGAELDLIDEDTVESYRFHEGGEGSVSATFGSRSGPVCAPVLRYLVRGDAVVQFSDGCSVMFTWEQVEFSGGIVTAKCGEVVKRFAYTLGSKRGRYLP